MVMQYSGRDFAGPIPAERLSNPAYVNAHAAICAFLDEAYRLPDAERGTPAHKLRTGMDILNTSGSEQAWIFLAGCDAARFLMGSGDGQGRDVPMTIDLGSVQQPTTAHDHVLFHLTFVLDDLLPSVIRRRHPAVSDLLAGVEALLETPFGPWVIFGRRGSDLPPVMDDLITLLEEAHRAGGWDRSWNDAVGRIQSTVGQRLTVNRKLKFDERVNRLLGVMAMPLNPADPWAEAAMRDMYAATAEVRDTWMSLLERSRVLQSSKPTLAWLKKAGTQVDALGAAAFRDRVLSWFALVGKPASVARPGEAMGQPYDPTIMLPENELTLRGLVWACATRNDPLLARGLGDLAVVCFKKVPNIGARCPKVANACTAALSAIATPDAIAQLSRLKTSSRKPSAQRVIETALRKVSEKTGMSALDLEETSVPSLGLTDVGVGSASVGEFTANVRVRSVSDVELTWVNPSGRLFKSAPAAVKSSHAEQVRDLNRRVKDVQKLLPTLRDRLEATYLSPRDWTEGDWRRRFLDHPLVGVVARRLIWQLESPRESVTVAWHDGRLVGPDDVPVSYDATTTRVRLWHPLDTPKSVVDWRHWLERHGVTQPFKQAHREVYVLTDAERATATYSNRFAAHILRQHQMHALCEQRGWRYRLQGTGFDGANFPTLDLRALNLCVEYWIEPAESEHGDASPSGISLYVTTDQVRFHSREATGAQPLLLADIPIRVFSEVMRGVDLFVGVCSIGNDPNWLDARQRTEMNVYWRQYAFGELNESARTRHDVLATLLPRLKIAPCCSLQEKFLAVRGRLRSYKIHLGSGNILMEPDDQYLCIVPGRGRASADDSRRVYLPFEGDGTLAVILSKAFLLADDDRIVDPSIVSQIRR